MARVRTNKTVCLNCFGTLDGQRVCFSCHKKADDTPAPPHHLPQRTLLNDKYLICRAIGEGGFGITYLAWDISCGLKVAIKEYYPSGFVNRMPRSNQVIINSKQNQAASNRGLRRFIDEAKTLAKVKNLPGIVSVRDFFSANGTAYIVMEYLDGISLKKYLQRKGKLPCDEILAILRPIMDSLVSVHKSGLIHRDISPDNILITKNNEVKLIDFGAAKQSNLDGKSLSIVLKQGFAPEEQYRTHGEQGPWTDIYALGVTIYYAITGTLPPESIQRLYKDTIVRPSEKGAIISPTQESALMKSLAVYAQHRYQDVTQMIAGLYGSQRTAPARTVIGSNIMSEPAPRAGAATPTRPSVTPAPARPVRSIPASAPIAPTERSSTRTVQPASTTRPTATPNQRTASPNTATPAARPTPVTNTAKAEQPATQRPASSSAQEERMVTITREHKPTLMERLFGKKKK